MILPSQRQGIATVSKFSDSFSLAGGLNLPKIIECIGSDGLHYKQLVKGKAHVLELMHLPPPQLKPTSCVSNMQ